jgi:hypothetical protein
VKEGEQQYQSQMFKVFENRVLRRLFGPVGNEMSGHEEN